MTHDHTPANRLILQPLIERDPRTTLDEGALVQASYNAFPIVARRAARKDSAGLIAGGGVALVLGGLTLLSMNGHRGPSAPTPLPNSPQIGLPTLDMPSKPLIPRDGSHPLLLPSGPAAPPAAVLPPLNRGPTPIVVFDNGVTALPAAVPPPAGAAAWTDAGSKVATAGGGTENDQFATQLRSGSTETATAERLSSPATTITQGTLIPAILETAIDTDLPGYVRAVVSRDVRSFDGSQVLIPRSSRLIGQYKSGLASGQTRAFVIWTRLIRPDGASVALASPAVEFSGASGLDGKVNSHFLKRFGAAALLTVIGGLSAVGNPSVVLSGGTSAAGVATQGNAQIPPTIRVDQGQPIRVFTARDLDFSSVSAETPDDNGVL